jgi:DNA-binding LytR/AlgR family response regulator
VDKNVAQWIALSCVKVIEFFYKKNILIMNKKYVNGSAYNSEHVFVMIEWGYKRVCIHDILYLEAQQDCCNIYLLKDNKVGKIMVTIPLCEVLEDLDIEHFMRIHRSYAVNIEHILYIYMYCAATPLIPNLNQKSTSTWERHSFATNLNSTQ